MNGLGGCGCGKIESLGSYSGFVPGSTGAFGEGPDGLGQGPQWAAAGFGGSPAGSPPEAVARFWCKRDWYNDASSPWYQRTPGPCVSSVNPEGLGAIDFGSVTGHAFLDAALVAGLGYFIAPSPKERNMWAAAGAAAGGLMGTVGLIAIVGFAMYSRKAHA
jgi:hypothetical protein